MQLTNNWGSAIGLAEAAILKTWVVMEEFSTKTNLPIIKLAHLWGILRKNWSKVQPFVQ